MFDQTIEITGASRARRIKRRFAAVITIEDPATPTSRRVRFHRNPHPAHLVLVFEDLDKVHESVITASESQVASALEFARANCVGPLLIHCHAGIARSTAVALAIIADRIGADKEGLAIAELLKLQPRAVPNLLVVTHADRLLGRGGKLLKTVKDWDSSAAWNRRRRQVNEEAVLEYYERAGPSWATLNKAR